MLSYLSSHCHEETITFKPAPAGNTRLNVGSFVVSPRGRFHVRRCPFSKVELKQALISADSAKVRRLPTPFLPILRKKVGAKRGVSFEDVILTAFRTLIRVIRCAAEAMFDNFV